MNLAILLPDRLRSLAASWLSFTALYKVPIVLVIISLLCFTSAAVMIRSLITPAQPIKITTSQPSDVLSNTDIQYIVVDIEGAVKSPGVYKMPLGSRISDVISSAGGLTTDADSLTIEKTINAAQKVSDGQKIYFPRLTDKTPSQSSKNIKSTTNTSNIITISINLASSSELEALSGVGPVTAEKIINNRPYSSLEELINKKVLGEKLYEKIKDQLTL